MITDRALLEHDYSLKEDQEPLDVARAWAAGGVRRTQVCNKGWTLSLWFLLVPRPCCQTGKENLALELGTSVLPLWGE